MLQLVSELSSISCPSAEPYMQAVQIHTRIVAHTHTHMYTAFSLKHAHDIYIYIYCICIRAQYTHLYTHAQHPPAVGVFS